MDGITKQYIENDKIWIQKMPESQCACPVKFKLESILDLENKPNKGSDITLLLTQHELQYLSSLNKIPEYGHCGTIRVWEPKTDEAITIQRFGYSEKCDICEKLIEITQKSVQTNNVKCQNYKLIELPSKCGCSHKRILQALNSCVVPHEKMTSPSTFTCVNQDYINYMCAPVHRGIYHIVRPTLVSNSVAVKYITIMGEFCPVCKIENLTTSTISLDEYQFTNLKYVAKKMTHDH